jgi:hypothetical protein
MIAQKLLEDSLSFKCSNEWDDGEINEWIGTITKWKVITNYLEILISSRSSLYVICGKGERGYWACIPDYMAGCDLSMSLKDTFYNTEKLFAATKNKVDAITIAEALKLLASTYIFEFQ